MPATATAPVPTPTAQRASVPPRRQSLTEVETERALELALDMGQGQKHLAIYELPFYGSIGPWRVKRKWRIVGANRTASGLPPETATPPPLSSSTEARPQGLYANVCVWVYVWPPVEGNRRPERFISYYIIGRVMSLIEFLCFGQRIRKRSRCSEHCLPFSLPHSVTLYPSPSLSPLLLSLSIYCFFRNRLSRMRTKRGGICSRWSFVWHAPRPLTNTHAYTEV